MTETLRYDGGNDYGLLSGTINVSDNSSFKFKISKVSNTIAVLTHIAGINTGNRCWLERVNSTDMSFTVRAFNTNTVFTWTDAGFDFDDVHEFEYILDGTDSFFHVDGNLEATVLATTRNVRLSRLVGDISGNFGALDLYHITITDTGTSSNDRFWNADSASSAGAGTVLYDDLVGANNATLVGAPVWINVSSGATITADSGSYTLSGTDASLLASRVLDAISGSYVLSGTDVNLVAGALLTADSGVYSLSGTVVTLTFVPGGDVLSADSGNYALIGSDINFNRDRVIIAASGVYTYNGTDVQLKLPVTITVNPRNIITVGRKSNLIRVKRNSNIIRVR